MKKRSIWGLSLTQAFDTTGDDEMCSSGAEKKTKTEVIKMKQDNRN